MAARAPHVVFMNYDFTGHINPTLPVVAGLVQRGCKVTYFVHDCVRCVVEATGADWRPFRAAGSGRTGLLDSLDEAGMAELVPAGVPMEATGKLMGCLLYDAREVLPALLEDLRALAPAPAVIVYDAFVVAARVAAQVLHLPSVGFVPHPGPGVLSNFTSHSLELEGKPWVQVPRQDIQQLYGLDVLGSSLLLEFYSPLLNLVTTIDDFFAPATHPVQGERTGHCPFRCVGAVADAKVERVANCNVKVSGRPELCELPFGEIDAALAAGKHLVLISLGTVVSGPVLWSQPLGDYAAGNDHGCPAGARGLAEHSGKEFSHFVWQTCFEALGTDENLLVVMVLGPAEDALEGMPPTPANFMLRKAVPQLEVLRRCSAFVTHGGANSMHEALAFGVPLAVVPVFGDQPTNADSVERVGAGASFRNPLRTLSANTLRSAVVGMLAADSQQRAGAEAMRAKLAAAGGVAAACDAILELVGRSAAGRGGA